MPRTEDQNVIQTVVPKGSDQAFNIGGAQGHLDDIGRSRNRAMHIKTHDSELVLPISMPITAIAVLCF
jgi:hypothetical protein